MSRLQWPLIAVAVLACAAVFAARANGSGTPVGPLPAGPASTVHTTVGQLVSVALPHRSGGRSWRIARAFNAKVVTQATEGDVGPVVVLVFRARGRGTTTLRFALTRGERAHAYEARSVKVVVAAR
jgi:hypothetical protein